MTYRQGRRNPHAIWWQHGDRPSDGDRFVGSCVTPAAAAALVEAANWTTRRTPMTDPATTLANALPKDPDDHGPTAVPSDAVRGVLAELDQRRKTTVTYNIGGIVPRPVANLGPDETIHPIPTEPEDGGA